MTDVETAAECEAKRAAIAFVRCVELRQARGEREGEGRHGADANQAADEVGGAPTDGNGHGEIRESQSYRILARFAAGGLW
jgi:hypothetical protein